MNRTRRALARPMVLAGLAAAMIGGLATVTFAEKGSAKAAKPKKKTELSGAQLYSMNCSRCHAERYPTEFTAAQWKTVMLHMRVRANLPASEARKILKYLQEDSGR